jgi:aspartate carbamoyltransferase regulatory subunit
MLIDMSKKIQDIKYGMVIDHIKPGRGRDIADCFSRGLYCEEHPIFIAEGVPSTSMEKKDIVKVEDIHLRRGSNVLNEIALFGDPTVNMIKRGKVIEKKKVMKYFSDVIETDLINCANPNCITQEGEAPRRFYTVRRRPLEVRCHYCGREFEVERK